MTGGTRPSARRPSWHLGTDVALLLLTLGLTAFTLVILLVPAAAPATVNDRLDITIITSAALITGAVSALAWSRGRLANDTAAVLRGSAFAVLALLNGLTLLVGLIGADAELGMSLEAPGQLPILAGMLARGTAAVLLVAAGVAALSRRTPNLSAFSLLIFPPLAVELLLVLMAMRQPSLPVIAPPGMLEQLSADPTAPLRAGAAPLVVIIQSLIGAAYLAAAVLAHRSYRRSHRAGDALLAAGFLIAAFSQAHSAIHVGSYASVVTTGDLLRLAFYGLLLVGIVVDSRDDLADLRAATEEVRRLAEAEFAAATLQERARLAREIHDGLAQDLWYAKLKQSRIGQVAELGTEGRQLADEVATALDAALSEARIAISALREGAEAGPLIDILRRQVEDFADRFAVRAELDHTGPEPEIGPRAQAELVRIVQEALTNVRKHADATVVRIGVETGSELRITISDNGRGFIPEAVESGFGLESMRQRAALIGAELTISSQAQDGSRVELRMPLGSGEA